MIYSTHKREYFPMEVHSAHPMRPKARGLAQRGGPPCWLKESDPAGCDFVRDGRSMPPALTDHTTCTGLGLIYYTNVHKTPSRAMSRKEGTAWYSSRPKPSLCAHQKFSAVEMALDTNFPRTS
jgi:hypothetical protein